MSKDGEAKSFIPNKLVCTSGFFSDELGQNFTLTWGGATTITGAYNRQTLLLNEV
jgi:hypothetical protein